MRAAEEPGVLPVSLLLLGAAEEQTAAGPAVTTTHESPTASCASQAAAALNGAAAGCDLHATTSPGKTSPTALGGSAARHKALSAPAQGWPAEMPLPARSRWDVAAPEDSNAG